MVDIWTVSVQERAEGLDLQGGGGLVKLTWVTCKHRSGGKRVSGSEC